MAKCQFDSESFYASLDAVRLAKGFTWRKVSEESGVSASTLTRMAQGRRPDVDSLAALISWSGLSFGNFIAGRCQNESSDYVALEMICSLLRSDPNLSPMAATTIDTTMKVLYDQLRRSNQSEELEA